MIHNHGSFGLLEKGKEIFNYLTSPGRALERLEKKEVLLSLNPGKWVPQKGEEFQEDMLMGGMQIVVSKSFSIVAETRVVSSMPVSSIRAQSL